MTSPMAKMTPKIRFPLYQCFLLVLFLLPLFVIHYLGLQTADISQTVNTSVSYARVIPKHETQTVSLYYPYYLCFTAIFGLVVSINLIRYTIAKLNNKTKPQDLFDSLDFDNDADLNFVDKLELTQKINQELIITGSNDKSSLNNAEKADSQYDDILKTIVSKVEASGHEDIEHKDSNPFDIGIGNIKVGAFIGSDSRYRLDAKLAEGGAGVLYRGFDTKLNRVVALKQLFPELESKGSNKKRFIEEARSLAALNSPYIVQIYDVIDSQGCWLIMEFLQNGDLANMLDQQKKIPLGKAIVIIGQIAIALKEAHKQGFIHRDIKPGNILFDDKWKAKLTDFGIVKSEQSTVKTTVGMILGSPAYLAPEQASEGEITAAADIYALGATFYHILAGNLPFTGSAVEVIRKHIAAEIPDIKGFEGTDVMDLIKKMMAKKSTDRYQRVDDLIIDLKGLKSIVTQTKAMPTDLGNSARI